MSAFDLVGGSYAARSPNFDNQKTINLYPEMSNSGTSKDIAMLIGCPGLRLWSTMTDLPIRGTLRISATTAIVVAGGTVYRVTTLGVATVIGTIATATTPVSMASNGLVVMLVTGGFGYIITIAGFVLTQITDVNFVGADKVDFLDGYFVFNTPGTQRFQITGLYSPTIPPLAFASAEGSPDLLISLLVDHRELWLFGETSTEVFFNSGNPDFPFERIQGAFIEQGCAAKNSVAKMDNTIIWLTADERGYGTVQKAVGYTPQRISNHALEFAIASYSRVDDAVGYSYQQEGHVFYMLSFPTANATWCFDAATELWHQRAWRNPAFGSLERHRSQCQMAFAGENIVGDWENGKLYVLDLDTYTDDGGILPSIRQCPHLSQSNFWQYFWKLWIDMQTGVGLVSGQGSDPELLLEWSDDGGQNFPNALTVKAGKIGERKARANFRRLGKSRDRVWRLTITDPVKRILIGGDVNFTVGAS